MSEKSLQKETEALETADTNIMEEILLQLGGLGTYQRLLFLMMWPIGFILSFTYASQMFVSATPRQHWCTVPELAHLDIEQRRNLSIPGAASGQDWDRCRMYDANWTQVLANLTPPDPDTATVPCRNGWEFIYDDIPYTTIVSEREWVCDKASFAPLAQTLFFVGSTIGCGTFGWIGDKYGRVPALMGSNLIGCLGGLASVFTVGFWDWTFCRFLVGMANDSCFAMLYIIVLEYVDSRYRSWMGNLSLALFVSLGGTTLPFLALWIRNWQRLLVVTSMPMLLVLAAPWVVPESASWLISTGKTKRAVKVLRKFERINGKKIPEELMESFVASANKVVVTDESMMALVKSAPLRNSFACLILVTCLSSIVIDSILRLSESIGSDFFVTYALSSTVEMPAMVLVALILDKVGRRFLTAITTALAGVLSLACVFAAKGTPQLILALMIRFCINMSIGVQIQLGAEMLPTGLRAMGTSIIHITACVATAFSPFVVYSGARWESLPLLILSVLGLLGGSAALLLPETKGRAMPQTIAEGETLVRENTLYGKRVRDDQGADVMFLENKNSVHLDK